MSNLNWNVVHSQYVFEKKSSLNNEEYLFKMQLEQIKENVALLSKNDNKDINKVIGIVGERGAGKSSVLATVSHHLKDEYILFDTIDPNILNGNFSILELFLSEIYKEVTSFSDDNINDYFTSRNDGLKDYRRTILETIKEITKMFSNIGDSNAYKKESPSIDILNNIAEATSFNKKLKNLIESFVQYINHKNSSKKKEIIICIDDLDLVSNDRVFSILEHIRKYLSTNIIVLIAYREQQLFDSVIHGQVKENTELLKYSDTYITHEEIKNQASKYIEKFVPIPQRTYLFDNSQIMNKSLIDFLLPLVDKEVNEDAKKELLIDEFVESYGWLNSERESDEISVSEWIYFAVKSRTKIDLKPIDKKEESAYILPNSIRGLFQFIEILHLRMKPINDKNIIYQQQSLLEYLIGNLQILKENLESSVKEHFIEDDKNLFEQWNLASYSGKNYIIYENLFWRINSSEGEKMKVYSEENKNNLLRITEIQTYNISIGDVFFILEEYKKVSGNSIEKIYFIYCLKVFYSIMLLSLYLNAALKENTEINEFLEQYLMIINAKIMPDDFIYFEVPNNKKNEKENNFGVRYESYYKYKKEYQPDLNFINKITYTDVSVGGEVRAANRATLEDEYTKDKYDNFKYRHFFKYSELKLVDGRQYLYDPFTFMTKMAYVQKSINQLSKNNTYVFYSLFDIDIFIRINYTRQSQKTESDFKYTLRKINKIFKKGDTSSLNQQNEIDVINRLSGFIFEREKNEKSDIYSPTEISYSDDFFKTMILLDDEKKQNIENQSNKTKINNNAYEHKLTNDKFIKRVQKLKETGKLSLKEDNQLNNVVERISSKPRNRSNKEEQILLAKLESKYNTNEE